MKMKLFFAAVTMVFSMAVVTSCGGGAKKNATSEVAEVAATTTEKCDSTKTCCKADSTACCKNDKTAEAGAEKPCCQEKAAE